MLRTGTQAYYCLQFCMAATSKVRAGKTKTAARRPKAESPSAAGSVSYLLNDYPRTLFPLSTTRVIAENWGEQVLEYVYQKVLNPDDKDHSFLAQARCYSSKQGFHLRRTMKLDPVAELFIYDLSIETDSYFARTSAVLGGVSGTGLRMANRSLRPRVTPPLRPP
jgi:hypothetical protein